MTEWKIATKKVDNKIVELSYQVDDKGNIYQKGGGILPKACQKCGVKFTSKTISTPVYQDFPLYYDELNGKEFDNAQAVLDYKIDFPEATIKKKKGHRLVGYENILSEDKSYVNLIKKQDEVVDVMILCKKCDGI